MDESLFLTASSRTSTQAPSPGCPTANLRYRTSPAFSYQVYDDVTTTWEHAYDYCKKSGAHLGSFEDEDESSYVMVTHNRRNCKSSCDTGYIWRSSTTEEDRWEQNSMVNMMWSMMDYFSAASKEILEKLESWSNKQKPEHGTIVNCPIVAMSGYLGEDNCLLDSYEEGLGFVCSERIAKLPSRPKSSAPDTTKEGVTHKRKNGTVAHFHVVTGRVTSERVARNECAEIGYELARFTDESEEQFIIEQFQRRHCPYCFGAYRVDWHGAGTKCKKLSFRHKSQMYTGCKRPTARKLVSFQLATFGFSTSEFFTVVDSLEAHSTGRLHLLEGAWNESKSNYLKDSKVMNQ
ncbi:hypothetical protein Y032_0335g2874 [Ancylostoma ceylanicum]|uniref:C-type lectin domain-containing protein n=1 Tax=Ancylostoma ceylanicum TaxID=53326 RepID=A0A016RZE9_9BILA|nr:hypothetical protein Y032_0335g2874 [Ancylostoma ceylanicum]